jgi:hypothetical protein
MDKEMDQESSFDPGTRRLCPDGSCIGVLNAAGLCGECRRKFDADAIAAAAKGNAQTWAVMDRDMDMDAAAGLADEALAPGSAAGSPSDFDPNRRLCADGSCVGVIGANGTCTVCGRVAG